MHTKTFRFALLVLTSVLLLVAAVPIQPLFANSKVANDFEEAPLPVAVPGANHPAPVANRGNAVPQLAATPYDVLQFNYDPQHSGNNTLESTINITNVATLTKTFKITLSGVADGTPVYLSGVTTPSGVRDLLFLNTTNGYITARDAHTGAKIWVHQYPAGSCTFDNGATPCFTPSSPAIDPNRQYVYAYGLDGYVHKYQVGDGTEITGNGWPELSTLKPNIDKGSANLAIATDNNGTTFLYMTHSSESDYGDYQGILTTINLADGSQHVFNALCSNQVDVYFVASPGTPDCSATKAGIWERAGVIYDPATNKIYVGTGDGPFNASTFYWGDSVLALNPDGTGSNGIPIDSYTYPNYKTLGNHDPGSTSVGILPTPSNSNVQHLGVQGGKDGKLRLLNLDDLSGQGGPGHVGGEISIISVPQGGEILTAPAVWVNPSDGTTWVFYANNYGTSALQLVVDGTGTPSLQTMWTSTTHGTSPIIANGVLFIATGHLIRALNPVTGALLWSNTNLGGVHWESPLVANGVLYITDQAKHLVAFKLP